jgi:hypothetical protein
VARRRIKTSFTHISLATWFPPADEIATCMARLCALREDLFIEFKGLKYEPLPELDEGSADYRRTYFVRNQFRTLYEIMGCFKMIKTRHKAFMAEVYKHYPQVEAEFAHLGSLLDEAKDQVEKMRHAVGGHLQHIDVGKGLTKLPEDTKGLFQRGNSPDTIHYKFALEILGATILRDVSFSATLE